MLTRPSAMHNLLMLHGACKLTSMCVLAQAKLEAKEREHFKKKGISFEGKQLQRCT